jgi:hypothetical protein
MGRTCSTHGWNERYTQIFVRKPEGRDYLGNTGEDGRIILK